MLRFSLLFLVGFGVFFVVGVGEMLAEILPSSVGEVSVFAVWLFWRYSMINVVVAVLVVGGSIDSVSWRLSRSAWSSVF